MDGVFSRVQPFPVSPGRSSGLERPGLAFRSSAETHAARFEMAESGDRQSSARIVADSGHPAEVGEERLSRTASNHTDQARSVCR